MGLKGGVVYHASTKFLAIKSDQNGIERRAGVRGDDVSSASKIKSDQNGIESESSS